MLKTLVLSFLAGLSGANAFPHFVKGITKESYPTVFGSSSVPNFLAGWSGLVTALLIGSQAQVKRYPMRAFIAGALGVLLMGLFHAGPGAFGKKSN